LLLSTLMETDLEDAMHALMKYMNE
jgi:hypothetical protein